MSRSFDLSRKAEREFQYRSATGLPEPPELYENNPVLDLQPQPGGINQEGSWAAEALLEGEVVEGFSVPFNQVAREQLTSLVRGLFLLPSSTVRAVAIAATEPGTEVAAATLGAAECLSNNSSRRVCVVDADFDHPHLQAHFQPRSLYGLSDVLQGKASLGSALTRISSNLWALPAGTAGQTQAHKIDSLMDVMAILRRESDYLLLQAPPLSDTNAAIAFANLTDGMVVVLEANRTRRDFAKNLKAKLDAANVNVLGAVFNNRTFPVPRSIYSKL